MITQGPFTFTQGSSQQIADPYATSGGAAGGVQILNDSSFAMVCTGSVTKVVVPPFTVQTIALPVSGASITLTAGPSATEYALAKSIFLTWLLPGETSGTLDGALPVPAVNIGLATVFGPDLVTQDVPVSLGANLSVPITEQYNNQGTNNNGVAALYGIGFTAMNVASSIILGVGEFPYSSHPIASFSVPAGDSIFYLWNPVKIRLGVGTNPASSGTYYLTTATSVTGYVYSIVYGGNM